MSKCQSFTLKGTKCTRKANSENGQYCRLHSTNPHTEQESKTEEPKLKCKGITTQQTRCTRYVVDSSLYCASHNEDTDRVNREPKVAPNQRCIGITRNNTRCTKHSEDNSKYCSLHDESTDLGNQEYFEAQKNKESRPFCIGITKNGIDKCSKRAAGNSRYCNMHDQETDRKNRSANYQKPPEQKQEGQKQSKYNVIFPDSRLNQKFQNYSYNKQSEILNFLRYYEIPPAKLSVQELRSKYRQYAIRCHPDKGGNVETFKKIQHIKEALEKFLE